MSVFASATSDSEVVMRYHQAHSRRHDFLMFLGHLVNNSSTACSRNGTLPKLMFHHAPPQKGWNKKFTPRLSFKLMPHIMYLSYPQDVGHRLGDWVFRASPVVLRRNKCCLSLYLLRT